MKRRQYNFIYAVSCCGFIKFGITGDVDRRIANMQCANPYPLIVEATIQSTISSLEKEIHDCLEAFRHRGEWFVFNDITAEVCRLMNRGDHEILVSYLKDVYTLN